MLLLVDLLIPLHDFTAGIGELVNRHSSGESHANAITKMIANKQIIHFI